MSRTIPVILVLGALAVTARAGPQQLTASAGDTSVQRFGPSGSGLVAVRSTGDLTPGLPGNADGSAEVYLLHLANRAIEQVTTSAANSSATRITREGLIVVSSNGDLTPGQPGNVDGSFENWLYTPAATVGTSSMLQMTSSAEDSFFQTFWDDGNRAFFVSKGDLAPGAPGNTDRGNEVFSYDVATHALTQLTNSPQASLIRAILPSARYGIVESGGDLTPAGLGNSDGSTEIFLLDLDTLALSQITASTVNSSYRGTDPTGRLLAIESKADLVPGGNADGSLEVFVYDRTRAQMRQLTRTNGDSFFAGFVPGSSLVAVESRQDLVPASGKKPGNADGSVEVYTVDAFTLRTVQQTASGGDSYVDGFANSKNGLAAIESNGKIDRAQGAVNSYEIFLQKLGTKRRPARRITRGGATDSTFRGFNPAGTYLAIESKADLVPGHNGDASSEVFVARTRRAPRLRQLTSSPADSTFGGFTGDGSNLLVNSRGDLDPTGLGNADGSMEVFKVAYGPARIEHPVGKE